MSNHELGISFFQIFTLGPKLGRGTYAQVRVASRSDQPVDTEKRLAVKIMDLRADRDVAVTGPLADLRKARLDSELKQDALQEAGVWRKAGQHPQIVGLVDAFLEFGASFFVMEFCDCSLLKFLERGANHAQLNERALGFVFKQNLLACEHIHSLDIVHRDIKPDNYMVRGQVVKLCDFGLACVLTEKGGLMGVNGTAPYMAPEMLKGSRYGSEVDIWSVGVMTYALFFGRFPYNGKAPNGKEMKKAIRDNDVSPSFEPVTGASAMVSEAAVRFCKGLLHRAPTRRWKLDYALTCDFMTACETLDDSLPDMLPMLSSAKRAGVFDKRRDLPEHLDQLLERLHTGFRGIPMGAMPPKEDRCDASSEDSSTAGTSMASNAWQQSGSLSPKEGHDDAWSEASFAAGTSLAANDWQQSIYSGEQRPVMPPARPNTGFIRALPGAISIKL